MFLNSLFFFKGALIGQRLKVLETYNQDTKPPLTEHFLGVGSELYEVRHILNTFYLIFYNTGIIHIL